MKVMLPHVLVLSALLCAVSSGWATPFPLKRFVVDLDLPPEQRWNHIVPSYRDDLLKFRKEFLVYIPKFVLSALEKVAADLDGYLPAIYAQEIRGIAQAANVSIGDVVLGNVMYDFTAFCTSIVVEDDAGAIFHGRNLDYHFTDVLRSMTFIVDFQRSGKTLFTATSYAFYIGILTGMRPHSFTISIDQRSKGAWWENLLVGILDHKKVVFVGFLVRDTLSTDGIGFNGAVSKLTKATLMAPVYFIIGGVSRGEGVIVTRDRLKAADLYYLNTTTERWFVVETNYDHWTTPPASDDRRDPAEHVLEAAGRSQASIKLLVKVLNTPPVLNKKTTYTTVMSAAFPDLYQAWKQLNTSGLAEPNDLY